MNQRIRRLALALMGLFAILFVQLNVIQVSRKTSLDDDQRNTRQPVRDFNEPRGDIVTADGVVVAFSERRDDSGHPWQRVYPEGELFADVTGYFTFAYGATQVERVANDVLAGRTAQQQIQGIASLFDGADTTGSVELTLDSRIQEAARSALGDREGSVVVVDVQTGAVKAMWSSPSYDPNYVATHDDREVGDLLEYLNEVPGNPLLANAYQERYMPGSTFKVITTAAALDAGVITLATTFAEESEFVPPQTDDPIQNYNQKTCGGDLTEVFRRSCNTPFARVALLLGPERMVEATRRFGIGEKMPFDLPRPAASKFGDTDYFEQNLPLLAIGGFGQGNTQMVPLHMALIAASVANKGAMMKPYVIDATFDHDGRLMNRTSPSVWKQTMTPATADIMSGLMQEVVRSGTASCCLKLANGVEAAAKTGTAQLNGPGEPERSHAWIIGFAPASAPRYAFAVMLKGTTAEISAGTGGTLAGPVAKKVLDVALTR
ncbi:MAG: peptidoglycan D,D-transpeptidase FtsI family protein [Actinomycetota bacterium]